GDTSAEQLTWRLNSIHDPNHTYTGTGNRAQGYDQWSTFYDKYLVTGAKVDIELVNSSDDETIIAGWLIATDGAEPVAISECDMKTNGGTFLIPPATSKKFSRYVSLKTLRAVKDLMDTSDINGASFGQNPSGIAWFTLLLQDVAGASLLPYALKYNITYHTTLLRPVPLPPSKIEAN
ncbi:hypothetical protein, partial [Nocardia mangyaensis]|uniref:hypothetical protein n=1 Tax=Nocardia mangyaensis TaxID=2213200 RepID=UPI002676FAC0